MSNASVVRGIYTAFSAGTLPTGAFANAVQIKLLGEQTCTLHSGTKAVREAIEQMLQHWPTLGVDVECINELGNTVVVRGAWAQPGRARDARGASWFLHMWRLSAGRVERFEEYAGHLTAPPADLAIR